MIQRIQSLYLLLATVLVALTNFFALAHFKMDEGFYTLTSFSIEASGVEAWSGGIWYILIPVVNVLTVALLIAAIFGYKHRIKQMRRCIYAILSNLLFYAVFGFVCWDIYSKTGVYPDLALMAELPLIAIILTFLAGRAIKRDEDMVRSMDRIR